MTSFNKDMITVLGPTATGKTSFATSLARVLDAEIISADSRQVYSNMDIGTGKDIKDYTIDGCKIPYHLVDIVDAGDKYNVFEFQSDFLKVYNKLKNKNVLPILCGGSGMYIESVLKGYKLIDVPVNEILRKQLEDFSLVELEKKLSLFNKLHNKTDIDTKKRAIRAIEIATFYKNNTDIDTDFPTIKTVIFGLKYERSIVKERITMRLKQRLREGMIEEVSDLLKSGISKETLEYYGLEYKFISQFLNKEFSYNHMVEKLNIAIHQFSKRQMTWFRKMERQGFNINWIDGALSTENKVEKALGIIAKYDNM